MPTATKKQPKVDKLTAAAAIAATEFELSGRELKALEATKKRSKSVLLEWLGDEFSRTLPDGRVVNRSVDRLCRRDDRAVGILINGCDNSASVAASLIGHRPRGRVGSKRSRNRRELERRKKS